MCEINSAARDAGIVTPLTGLATANMGTGYAGSPKAGRGRRAGTAAG